MMIMVTMEYIIIMLYDDADAERRGLQRGDEYLFNLDSWGRSQACQSLTDLGLKRGLVSVPREVDVDLAAVDSGFIADLMDHDEEDMALFRRAKRIRGSTASSAPNHHQNHHQNHHRPKTAHDDRDSDASSSSSSSSSSVIIISDGVTTNSTSTSKQQQQQHPHRKGRSWYEDHLSARQRKWRVARSHLSDEIILQTESG